MTFSTSHLFWTACLAIQIAVSRADTAAASNEGRTNSFFAFQNGLNLPPETLASTLKELGYDGLSTEGYEVTVQIIALKKEGLRLYNTYISLDLDAATSARTPGFQKLVDDLAGSRAAIWLTIPKVSRDGKSYPPSSVEGDPVAVERLRELSDYAEPRGVRIALYPHTGCWVERIADADRLAKQLNRPGVGSTFNLCHWLKVQGDTDPIPALQAALPHLLFVSINGADAGDTRSMGWNRLIQPLDQGTFDVGTFIRRLRVAGYTGPVGLQGYGVPGNQRENARRSIVAWRKMLSE